ncbi:MAG TPA: hypothetical protein VG165_04775 [Solirubrobacteraceae bacterium]|jgi:hypothetical protein|nr:hypothetical protein [Solirubrobacteraceae bacterium]
MSDRPHDPNAPRASKRPSAQRLPKALAAGRGPAIPVRRARPTGGRVVVAVLGSVAALGASAGSAAAATTPARSVQRSTAIRVARRADPAPAGELALLGLVFAALSAAAPAIARPLLARGVADETITEAEADAFIARLVGIDSTAATVEIGPSRPAARALLQGVFNAIRAHLPAIAAPLARDAVAAGSLTPAQAARIEQRIAVRAQLGLDLDGAGTGASLRRTEPLFTGRLP